MIDTKELRRLAQAALAGPDGISLNWIKLLQDFQQSANPAAISELLDRLEAEESKQAALLDCLNEWKELAKSAEKERDALRAALQHEADCVEAAKAEIKALRAKVAEMGQQEPVAWMHETRRDSDVVTDAVKHVWGRVAVGSMAAYSIPLYALPGAQPAPSVPDGWLRAIDEALVVANIGVANESDTYEQAREKLNNLIGLHVDIATDPAVNGGWKLVPETKP